MGAQESPSWIMSEGPQGHELQLLLATGQEVLLTSATGHDLWHWATGHDLWHWATICSLSLSLSLSLCVSLSLSRSPSRSLHCWGPLLCSVS